MDVIGWPDIIEIVMGFPRNPSQSELGIQLPGVIRFEWNSRGPNLRTLDTDLSAILRAGQEFSWDRIPFVLEAGLNSEKLGQTGD